MRYVLPYLQLDWVDIQACGHETCVAGRKVNRGVDVKARNTGFSSDRNMLPKSLEKLPYLQSRSKGMKLLES
jgi:hypothetical protein